MRRAQRIRLDPTNRQRTYFVRAAGTARFAYNWALAEWDRQSKAGEKPSAYALSRQLTATKRTLFPWMLEVTASAPTRAILQLGDAFQNFFAKRTKHPGFRRKGERERFHLCQEDFGVRDRMFRVGRLGWVRMVEPLRFVGKIQSATISLSGGEWYVSIAVEVPEPAPAPHQGEAVGVDLGVRQLATLSTGEVVVGPKPHKAALGRLRRLNQSLHRKVKGSRNRAKAKLQLSRLHARIRNVRQDALHKLTTDLTRRFSVIGIEDLNVEGMKATTVARSVSDAGFYEFRRQLEYKAAAVGASVVVADRFFPSSKTCSSCGVVNADLGRGDTAWRCVCGASHDRDLNAALNLRKLAVGSTVTACGAVEVHGVEAGTGQPKSASVPENSERRVPIDFPPSPGSHEL